ncbi:hypothetical protein C8R43DRAFT_875853, partial [Mycena crocata]
QLADGSFARRGLSRSQYLGIAGQFDSHLTMHHTYEEAHLFPILAERMPEFSTETEAGHVDSHKGIHDGLEALTALVSKFKRDPSAYYEFPGPEIRACLDSFREVLFTHLDAEVNDLRGENMKKYFTLEEVNALLAGHGEDD